MPALVVSGILSLVAGTLVPGAHDLGASAAQLLLLVVLTFVTPVLALDEPAASAALGRGLRILRNQGAAARWYAVAGPLLIVVLQVSASEPGVVGWAFFVLAGLWASLLRGATVAAYLRLQRTADAEGLPGPVGFSA